jgi:hypothetical protein
MPSWFLAGLPLLLLGLACDAGEDAPPRKPLTPAGTSGTGGAGSGGASGGAGTSSGGDAGAGGEAGAAGQPGEEDPYNEDELADGRSDLVTTPEEAAEVAEPSGFEEEDEPAAPPPEDLDAPGYLDPFDTMTEEEIDQFLLELPQAQDGPAGPFWRVEKPADSKRHWLIAPDGKRVFNLGVNTVMRNKHCGGILKDWIRRQGEGKASAVAHAEWARLSTGQSGGFQASKPYCFNNVGAFSETNDFTSKGGNSFLIRPPEQGGAGAPYSTVFRVSPPDSATRYVLKDASTLRLRAGVSRTLVGDPFNPRFAAFLLDQASKEMTPRSNDPRLQMWFAGNEIGLFDRGLGGKKGVRDFRRWIWSECASTSTLDAPRCAPHALAAFLRERYGSIDALNEAWASSYSSFLDLLTKGKRPVPYTSTCGNVCRGDLQRFVHDRLLRQWIKVVTETMRKKDPNHLISTPRLAVSTPDRFKFWRGSDQSNPDVWVDDEKIALPPDAGGITYTPFDLFPRDGAYGFDLVSFNLYTGSTTHPQDWLTEGFHRIGNASKLPLYISEFSVRARIKGWANRGGYPSFVPDSDSTDDQIQRGAYYREQARQFLKYHALVGITWHAWSDRYLAANKDQQINMGLVQCRDPARGHSPGARWGEIDDRIRAFNCDISAQIQEITPD